MSVLVTDPKGRTVISIRGDDVAIARFDDLDDDFKEYLVNVYSQLTTGDVERFRKFLNYEEEEDEFCV